MSNRASIAWTHSTGMQLAACALVACASCAMPVAADEPVGGSVVA